MPIFDFGLINLPAEGNRPDQTGSDSYRAAILCLSKTSWCI